MSGFVCSYHFRIYSTLVLPTYLYLININDMGTLIIPNSKIISFVDDIALLYSASSWEDVYKCTTRP